MLKNGLKMYSLIRVICPCKFNFTSLCKQSSLCVFMNNMFVHYIFHCSFIRYVGHFQRLGVKGVDLLTLSENQLVHFGIESPIHVSRALACLSQLVQRQTQLDEEDKAASAEHERDRAYFDLKEKYDKLVAAVPPYQLPRDVKDWKAIDVFFFLSKDEHKEFLVKLVRPLALRNIAGPQLLDKIDEWVSELQ